MELINQILIEVYAAMAQQELEKRAKRQAEGIAVAKKKGVQFGRKRKEINEEWFAAVYQKWKTGEITARQAMLEVDLKPNTFYRRVGEYESMVEKVCKLS
jgi:DNA invertase Pin-like site-specific DNA recombinase